jgi:hypothetical protein
VTLLDLGKAEECLLLTSCFLRGLPESPLLELVLEPGPATSAWFKLVYLASRVAVTGREVGLLEEAIVKLYRVFMAG